MAAAAISASVNGILNKVHLKESHAIEVPAENDVVRLQARYDTYDQGHVLAFYGQLEDAEKAALYAQLVKFDPERVSVRRANWGQDAACPLFPQTFP